MKWRVIAQLLETWVRRMPRLSLWSQSKQTAFLWASVSDSYRALTAVSAALRGVGAALALAVANSTGAADAAAAVTPTVRRKSRRSRPLSAASQSGHTTFLRSMEESPL